MSTLKDSILFCIISEDTHLTVKNPVIPGFFH
jgi:hypothetical protein